MDPNVVLGDVPDGMKQLEIASALRRLGAWFLDVLIAVLSFVVPGVAGGGLMGILLEQENSGLDGFQAGRMVLMMGLLVGSAGMLVWCGANLALVASRGQSPGKIVMKVRIVMMDGSRLGFGRALLREIIGKLIIIGFVSAVLVWLALGVLGDDSGIIPVLVLLGLFIWILVDGNNQTMHDKIAGTYVVKV